MDVLVKSIDVRDLLPSSSTLDPTTPLASPDLRLLIDRLELRSHHIKSKVRTYLLTNHQHFSDLFALTSDSYSRSDSLSDDVTALVSLFSDRPIDVELRNTVDEIGESVKERRVKKEMLELVKIVVRLSEELRSVKEMVKIGRLVFAAEKVKDLKVAVRVGDCGDVDEPVVYGLLKKEWFRCFDEIQGVLLKFMEKVVVFECEGGRVRVKYQLTIDGIEGVELRTALEAMDVLGILEYGLSKVTDLMIKFVITPAINSCTPITFVEERIGDSDQISEVILKMVSSNDEIEVLNGENIYSRIILIIKFIFNTLCLQNGTWMLSFGKLTWPKISELIISNFLSKVVPDDASKLAGFQKIIKITSDFESSLKELRFISADKKDDRLSNFAENVEVHFASRKKTEILANARNILLGCNFTLPQLYTEKSSIPSDEKITENSSDRVVDLIFMSEQCVVSEAASQLMKLVHQTLKDVCLSSPRVGLEFYHAARDALLLYEAVIPIKLERQLDGINHVAALMHNDCLYLSQEILGLAFEYRSDFPSFIKEQAVFVDLAPKLQLMAEETLQRHIQIVCVNLNEVLDGADGFQNTHQMQQYESAKFSIEQVVFFLNKVRIIWEPLLLPTYNKSMCIVLESVVSRMTKDILLLDDMAADETLQLQRLIHFLLESLPSLLRSPAAVNKEDTSPRSSTQSLDDLIPSLRKIRKLEDLLDMPLKSITTAWQSGELSSCGFTLSEIEDFIRAIFTDSPLRKECLWKIENCFRNSRN